MKMYKNLHVVIGGHGKLFGNVTTKKVRFNRNESM